MTVLFLPIENGVRFKGTFRDLPTEEFPEGDFIITFVGLPHH
jgi:hypothetical protein